MLDSKPEPITFEHWNVQEWLRVLNIENSEEILYSIAVYPKADGAFRDRTTGYYVARILSKPPLPTANIDEYLALARNFPTEIQLAEMREAMLSLKMKTDEVEKEGEAKEEEKK